MTNEQHAAFQVLLVGAEMALGEMRRTTSPRYSFTNSVDALDAAIIAAKNAIAHDPQQRGEPVYLFRRKGLADFVTCDRARFAELSLSPKFETKILYASQQPAEPVVSVPDGSLTLDGDSVRFLAERVRRLSRKFGCPIEGSDDFVVNTAGSVIGHILATINVRETQVPPTVEDLPVTKEEDEEWGRLEKRNNPNAKT